MPNQRTTGLTNAQFTTLVKSLQTCLTCSKPNKKPRKLALAQALKMTLHYYRHHLTEEILARFFNISQPTVSSMIIPIEKALFQVLQPVIKLLKQALKISGLLAIDVH